jgi:16S rRNA (cytosine967-C5)-methyltransferase
VLREIERRRGFSNRILAAKLDAQGLDARDRAFATTLVYGVLRHRARIDHHIDAVARRPAKLRGEPREIARIAAYELLELERPLGIAADEAVRLTRSIDRSGALAGLMTAILAGVSRDEPVRDRELEAGPAAQVLARRWSIPPWLAARWSAQLGPEPALARARALAEPPPVDVRVDLGRIGRDEVARQLAERAPGARIESPDEDPQCLRLHGAARVWTDPLHEAGLFSLQGRASQQPAIRLAPRPGERVLDACAGVGGKTVQLCELMGRRGTVVAVDIDPRKLENLGPARVRCDLERPELTVTTRAGDLGDPALALGDFDAVLLDAPCTGLGNLARHPELRWTVREPDVAACAARQRRLLAATLARVGPGGRLAYAVCSLEPEEGPELVRAGGGPAGFRLASERAWTPEGDQTEGFYVALLQRA